MNCAFGSQNPEKIAPSIEEKLRKELGATEPIAFEVEDATKVDTSSGTVLLDITNTLLGGGKANLLFTVRFSITSPSPAELRAHVIRQGIGAYVGSLLYSTQLPQRVAGSAALDGGKKIQFAGDAIVSGALNGNKNLLKAVDKFCRPDTDLGAVKVSAPRYCRLEATDAGTTLYANTLPRLKSMGLSSSLEAKEFFELAAVVASAVPGTRAAAA